MMNNELMNYMEIMRRERVSSFFGYLSNYEFSLSQSRDLIDIGEEIVGIFKFKNEILCVLRFEN